MTQQLPKRWTRAVGYALMAFAGSAAILWPPPAVREAAAGGVVLVYVWATMLTVCGLCAAVGAAADRWLGEYAGLPPLVITFMIYGVAAAATGKAPAIAASALFGGIAFVLHSRWLDVALIRREAARYLGEHGRS